MKEHWVKALFGWEDGSHKGTSIVLNGSTGNGKSGNGEPSGGKPNNGTHAGGMGNLLVG